MERISSGYRINPAGLVISEKMCGLGQASRNIQDGISLVQTAEGTRDETHSILHRMRELASSTGSIAATQITFFQLR